MATAEESSGSYEALFARLEQQFAALQQEHELVKADRDRLGVANEQLAAKAAALQKDLATATTRAEEARAAAHRMELTANNAREEKESILAGADLKQRELDRLAEELRLRSERFQEASQREASLQAELSAAKAALRPLQLQTERLGEEKELLLKQKKWFEEELAHRQTALLEARKASASEEVDLKSQVESFKASLEARERELVTCQRELERLRTEHSATVAATREAEAASTRSRDALERQLSVQRRLAELHQASSEEAVKRVSMLEEVVSNLQLELGKAAERVGAAEAAVRAAGEGVAAQLRAQIASLQEEVRQTREEAKAAVAAAAATPSGRVLAALAADTSAGSTATTTALELLRVASGDGSAPGLTATALYARVQVAEEALSAEKRATNELRAFLNQVLSDLEAKAPIIQQQQRDYERALASHEELARTLNTALAESGDLASQLAREREGRVSAEQRVLLLRAEVSDLAKQVQTLLRQQLFASGGVKGQGSGSGSIERWHNSDEELVTMLTTTTTTGTMQGGAVTSVEPCIEDALLTFEDVEALQERNQQLIRVVRLLSRQLAQAGGVLGGKTTTLLADATSTTGATGAMEALRQMMGEVAQLKADREKHAVMVSTLLQQRDMYRVLLQQADATLLAQHEGAEGVVRTMGSPAGGGHPESASRRGVQGSPPPHSASSTSGGGGGGSADGAHYESARALLEDARGEIARLRHELREGDRASEAAAAALREELTQAKVAVATTGADVAFHKARAEALREAEGAARAEAQRAQARVGELQGQLVKHERELAAKEASQAALREEISSLTGRLAHVGAERDVHSAAEARMAVALREAQEDRDRYARMADSLRNLEASLGARDSSERQQLLDDRGRLQAEWLAARQALDDERTLAAQRVQAHAGELREASKRSEELSNDLAAARAELASARAEAESVRAQLGSLHDQLASASNRVEGRVAALGARTEVEAGRLVAVEAQLRSVSAELESAREALSVKERHLGEFKAISAAAEEGLRSLRAQSEKWREEANGSMEAARKEVGSLNGQIAALSATLHSTNEAHLAATAEAFKREDELRAAAAAASSLATSLTSQLEAARAREAELVKDVSALEESRRSLQHNYELQLSMHAADAKTLSSAQDRIKGVEEALRGAREEAAKAHATLLTSQQTWAVKEGGLAKAAADLTTQLADLKHQNGLLHSQLATMSAATDAASASYAARVEDMSAAISGSSTGASGGGAGGGGEGEEGRAVRSVKELREVVAFLRRQNEVLECRTELAEQRAAGLEEQALALRKEADEVRAQVHGKAASGVGGEGGGSSGSGGTLVSMGEHHRLLAAVNERNLLRESNETLRGEATAALARAEASQKRVAELEREYLPLAGKFKVLEAERDALREEVTRRGEETKMWRERLNAVLARHDTIDPAVHRALQEQLAASQAHLTTLTAQLVEARAASSTAVEAATATLRGELKAAQEALASKQREVDSEGERITRFRKAAAEQLAKVRAKDGELSELREAHAKEVAELQAKLTAAAAAATTSTTTAPAPAPAAPTARQTAQLEALRKQLAEANASHAAALAEASAKAASELAASASALSAMRAERDALAAQVAALKEEVAGLKAQVTTADAKAAALRHKIQQLNAVFVEQKKVIAMLTADKAASEQAEAPAPTAAAGTGTTTAGVSGEEGRAPPSPEPTPFIALRPPSATLPSTSSELPPLMFGNKPPTLPLPSGVSTGATPATRAAPPTRAFELVRPEGIAAVAAGATGGVGVVSDEAEARARAMAMRGRGGRGRGVGTARGGRPPTQPRIEEEPETPAPAPAPAPAPVATPVEAPPHAGVKRRVRPSALAASGGSEEGAVASSSAAHESATSTSTADVEGGGIEEAPPRAAKLARTSASAAVGEVGEVEEGEGGAVEEHQPHVSSPIDTALEQEQVEQEQGQEAGEEEEEEEGGGGEPSPVPSTTGSVQFGEVDEGGVAPVDEAEGEGEGETEVALPTSVTMPDEQLGEEEEEEAPQDGGEEEGEGGDEEAPGGEGEEQHHHQHHTHDEAHEQEEEEEEGEQS